MDKDTEVRSWLFLYYTVQITTGFPRTRSHKYYAETLYYFNRLITNAVTKSNKNEINIIKRQGNGFEIWSATTSGTICTQVHVSETGCDLLEHYLVPGAGEGNVPGPEFSTVACLERYP